MMQIMMPCFECLNEFQGMEGPKNQLMNLFPFPKTVNVSDDGTYSITCEKGHTSLIATQQHKHETLFELAVFAILDGYFREAVTSFASSLERFYEFVIDFCLHKSACEASEAEKAWSNIAKQSERQLGAFIILYTSIFGSTPDTLGTKKAAFRNEVVHKGRIPTREEAISFGQSVLEVIRPALREIKNKYPDFEHESFMRRASRLSAMGDEKNPAHFSTMHTPSIFSNQDDDIGLKEYLSNQSKWHAIMMFQRYLSSPNYDLKSEIQTAFTLGKIDENLNIIK